ncbi:hypothetical protein JTB14_015276 [Gonioctena quinquepunctata]|nr:hypothetical protein JTB14_015276 [Gonioctena quinquepunctata]
MDMGGADNPTGLQLQLILSQLNVLTQSTSEIRQILMQQNEKSDACMKKVDSLQLERDELRSKVEELDGRILSTTPADIYIYIYNEIRMRIEREKNIIIFGIAENSDTYKLVRDILNETALQEIQINDISRLGRVEDNKARPVKVELSNKKDAIAVMKRKHKLSARFPGVKIKQDKTPKELDEVASIYKELNRR